MRYRDGVPVSNQRRGDASTAVDLAVSSSSGRLMDIRSHSSSVVLCCFVLLRGTESEAGSVSVSSRDAGKCRCPSEEKTGNQRHVSSALELLPLLLPLLLLI